jgi:ankyrin repeat protein
MKSNFILKVIFFSSSSAIILTCNAMHLYSAVEDLRYKNGVRHIQDLIAAGEDPCACNRQGRTMLHMLTEQECNEAVKCQVIDLLVNYSKKIINTQDSQKTTALHLAAHEEEEHVIRKLIFHGANPCLRSRVYNPRTKDYTEYFPYQLVKGNSTLRQYLRLEAAKREAKERLITFLLTGLQRTGSLSSAHIFLPEIRKTICMYIIPTLTLKKKPT